VTHKHAGREEIRHTAAGSAAWRRERHHAAARYIGRQDWYDRGRPDYPAEVMKHLAASPGVAPAARIADIGAGTGIFSEALLRHGYEVWAVEPNAAMLANARQRCAQFPRFRAVPARAESTTLDDDSVDAVTVGQALHWFEPELARPELLRILRRGGSMIFVWNERRRSGSPFAGALDGLLQKSLPAYQDRLAIGSSAEAISREFLGHDRFRCVAIDHAHSLDAEDLVAMVMSLSFAPRPDEPLAERLASLLRRLHSEHAVADKVTLSYLTTMIRAGGSIHEDATQ
jgi:SAM-dependent methyltransferase